MNLIVSLFKVDLCTSVHKYIDCMVPENIHAKPKEGPQKIKRVGPKPEHPHKFPSCACEQKD